MVTVGQESMKTSSEKVVQIHLNQRDPREIGRLLVGIAFVILVCGALRIWLIGHTEVIARDGITYVKMASELSAESFSAGEYDYHPGYPAAMVGVHWLLRSAGLAGDNEMWELSGQYVSLAASLMTLVGVWAFAGMTFNWRIAWVSALLFGVGRKFAALGADVLSDSLAVCLQMWVVVIALVSLKLLERKSYWVLAAAAGVGLCGGLGYLVRPEALLAVGLACILWGWTGFRRQVSWRLALASVAIAVAVTLACSLPYMIAIGGLTGKKSLSDFVAAPLVKEFAVATASMISAAEFIAPRQLINQLFEAMHPATATLACVWLCAWGFRRTRLIKWAQLSPLAPHRAGAFMMLAVPAVMGGLLMAMYVNVRYLDFRHVLFSAALLSALAGPGALVLVGLGKNLFDRIGLRLPQNIILVAFVSVVAVAMAVHSLEPLHAGKAYFREAGEFVAASMDDGAEDFLLTDSSWVLYYSRARGEVISASDLAADALIDIIRKSPATHLALGDRNIRKAMGEAPLNLDAREFAAIGKIQQERPKQPDTIRIYRIKR